MVEREWVGPGDDWPEAVSDGLNSPCQLCGLVTMFDYTITDEMWNELVSHGDRQGVVCLPCLHRIALYKGIDFADHLIRLQFTGKGQTIIFEPRRIVDYDMTEGEMIAQGLREAVEWSRENKPHTQETGEMDAD